MAAASKERMKGITIITKRMTSPRVTKERMTNEIICGRSSGKAEARS